jgi:hypothetical protein
MERVRATGLCPFAGASPLALTLGGEECPSTTPARLILDSRTDQA